MSFTKACTWVLPFTGIVALLLVTTTEPTTTVVGLTPMLTGVVGEMPLLVSTVTVSVPVPVPAVYVTLARPLLLVTAVEAVKVGRPLPLVGIENVTVWPTTGLPLASVT